jgi:hypothetical protein
MAGAAMVAVLVPTGIAHAQYPLDPELDLSGFAPECIDDAPYVFYDVQTVGFAWPGQATLQIFDKSGNPWTREGKPGVDPFVVTSQTGTFLFPGAKVDGDGKPIDWPGWTEVPAGSNEWTDDTNLPDNADHVLRDGIRIEVTVNPTSSTIVDYPPASPFCVVDPPSVGSSPPPPGQSPQPPQQGFTNPQAIPSTGSNVDDIVRLAVVAIAAGG